MPTYEFKCANCGEKFEIFTSIREKEAGLGLKCPNCGSDNVGQLFGGLVLIQKIGDSIPPSGSCCSRSF